MNVPDARVPSVRRVPGGRHDFDLPIIEEITLLTEATVEEMFRKMMGDPNRNEETFEKAEDLLEDELRPESPLRHRLSVELDELRSLTAKG